MTVGLTHGVDETEATAEGSVSIRFGSDTTLSTAIAAENPLELQYGFTLPGMENGDQTMSPFSLNFHLPRVFLPKKKQEIKGPGGIQASYDWRAACDPQLGYLLRVTLVKDVAGYW